MLAEATGIDERERAKGFGGWWQVGLFFVACAVVVSRRPDAVFHAQMWAEDGRVWFANAYNSGWWPTLFLPQDGYIQVLPRLGAGLALLLPLAYAPLAMNCVAIAVQALPVNLLLWKGSAVWGGWGLRAVLAGVYLALPNSREICATLTNSQWILALCAFLLVVAERPATRVGRVLTLGLLLVCGLTGPFCLFLAPLG